MDDWWRIHAKEEIKKWKRSLSNEDWQEYKRKHKISKEAGHRILRITKRIDKAIEDQDKISVEGEEKFLEQAYFSSYIKERNQVLCCLPSSLQESYRILYHYQIFNLYDTYKKKIRQFVNQPPSPPSSPTNLLTMDAINRCENSLSPEAKALLETKKAERRSIRIRVTKTINKLKKDVDAGNKFAVTNSRASLQKTLEELERKDDEIWQIYDDDAVAADLSQGEQWSEKGSAAITEADEFLDSLAPAISPLTPAPTPAATTAHFARLPKIDLPKFSGKNPAEYQTWWNSFESLIDKRPDLAKVDKLQYLKNCCVDKAKELAKGYSLTDSNYENFKKSLKDMFGRQRLIIQSHADNILDLKPFETDGIQDFLTKLQTALQCQTEFGIDIENGAHFLVPHVEELMPKEIL